MKILFTICGRAGSKGLSSKNIMSFHGFPLAFYTLSVIDLVKKQTEHEVHVALNTDSKELQKLFSAYPSVIFVERLPELATDAAGKIGVIQHTFKECQKRLDIEFDAIIDLDITSPMRTVVDVLNLINQYESQVDVDVVFSVVKSRRNPYFNMVEVVGEYVSLVKPSEYTARQQTPQVYDMNASMYLYKPSFLAGAKRIFEGKCGIVEMPDYHVLDIDSEDDFIWMSYIYEKLVLNNTELARVFDNITSIGNPSVTTPIFNS